MFSAEPENMNVPFSPCLQWGDRRGAHRAASVGHPTMWFLALLAAPIALVLAFALVRWLTGHPASRHDLNVLAAVLLVIPLVLLFLLLALTIIGIPVVILAVIALAGLGFLGWLG